MSLKTRIAAAKRYADIDEPADTCLGRAAQAARLITVLILAVIAIVGVLIYDSVLDALGDPSTTNAENRTQLENATVSVTEGFGSALDLVPVLLIVLVAALVIGVVSRLRR